MSYRIRLLREVSDNKNRKMDFDRALQGGMSMQKVDSSMAGYLHTYEAYRVPKGTTVKNASGEDVVLSNEEDVLVLTQKAGRQLVKDRKAYNGMLQMNAEAASQRTQEAASEKSAKDLMKIMAVYQAMAKGDTVPAEDEGKLLEYSPKLYQAAKMAQFMAQQLAKKEQKKQKSQWNEREEKEHREKMEKLRKQSDEAFEAMTTGSKQFSAAQKEQIVETDSAGVDISSMKVMNIGSGVTGMQIDLSI